MARSIQILSHLSWLLHVASWRVRSSPPNLMSIQPRSTEIQTTIKSSVRWWCRVMHRGIMTIKSNLHQPKSHLPGFRSWRPLNNKNCDRNNGFFLLEITRIGPNQVGGSLQVMWWWGWLRQAGCCSGIFWTRWCGGGGGHHHGATVLWRDFIFLAYVDTGMFVYMVPCNATVQYYC